MDFILDDHSRVRLSTIPGQKKTSDYINANFIDGYQKCNAYIGTQGKDKCKPLIVKKYFALCPFISENKNVHSFDIDL